ncbi:ABC transporter ATP-binding protein [Candidatus Dojkabacteria bacterium]|nr:ABC transporter ATP-binding protein [Candidatus Dojkabacteria bacterium]
MDKSEKILEIVDLSKKYKEYSSEVVALDSVSFSLKNGEDVAILGPSGSGKTTLLQLSGGLDKSTSGEVIVDGVNINNLSDRELSAFRNKRMGFIFQMINLHDFFTAKENIMVPMLINNVSNREAGLRAMELLKKMGMENRANHLPKQLSGGEQQRVAVARALANNPQIVFADEPTGKLDKKNSELIVELLEDISHERGTSVVMITHDENIAKRFSRIIKMNGGKLVSDITLKNK